ncbi:TPA: helix-turn-helix domain-containing protein [Burkholderia multivorans]|nr:helix-turn-helix domain-containing protein [Burkholderia multivorans]MBU9147404.1 helix-turn-helix domain-containing protein [Burkholderia multivorans]MCA8247980.1 helix-turn-helix domain-containing protein [Burkholderia multivorans]HDR9285170.1 helix-turn-helix domain-containing protein [Burkholderia multivorans]HDR9292539.1 helix-turn-helix domain-containing protein [Burkholderia multivorans]HDR9296554.1 helix-turn-helix domain-containing protein [Burkholderia multivorans]
MENPDFGRRAKERREALELSQKYVAELVGVSQPAIAKIERGGSTTTTNGFALARALQTTLEWLEFGEDVHPIPPGYDRLDQIGRAKVEAYISGLLAQATPRLPTAQDEDRPFGD